MCAVHLPVCRAVDYVPGTGAVREQQRDSEPSPRKSVRVHLFSLRRAGLVGGLLLPLAAVGAAPALAAGPGLPPGYQVQRIDSPINTAGAGFGGSMVPIGDVNGDGKEDFVNQATTGSLNGDGVVQQFSGETGQLLRSANAADSGGPVVTGNGRAGADGFISRMGDIGSCPNAPALDPNQPGPTCASATIGPPDGAGEILVGAGGVDVGGVRDVGRVYVLDGKTLAVLKRIDMPPADRALIAARQAENPLPATNVRGGFGRTAVTPRGLPPCEGNAGVGPCPSLTAMPRAVRIGDTDGGGMPDVVVGANNFPETGATANPDSHCAKNAGAALCLAAGRAYTYRGEEIAGSDPSVILDGTGPGQTPPKILKNIAAQADDPFNPAGRPEIFGHSQMEIGDVGTCQTGGGFPAVAPGERCSTAAKTIVPDGRPDYIIASHRADTPIFDPDPAFFETGVAFLYDGATGALLYTYNHPEPTPNALFAFTTGQTFALGDLGDTPLPDAVLAGFQDVQSKAQAGRAYVFSGNFTANFIVFGLMDDPTPSTFKRFGNPTEGVGDLVPDTPGNEVLVGAFSSVQTAGQADTLTDVHFFSPVNSQALQTISDPDAQKEDGFGYRVMPLGDLNGDGFLDFAASALRWDAPAAGGGAGVLDRGRIYIFRSDKNAVAPAKPGPAAGPPGAPGPAGGPGPAGPGAGGSAAVALAGRTIDLDASSTKLKRGGTLQLRGVVEAFANPAACEAGVSVLIQRRAQSSGRFATFQTVKTDRTGAFQTSRFTPASTQLYRARVVQTEACAGAQSTRTLVTAVPPKKTTKTSTKKARGGSTRR